MSQMLHLKEKQKVTPKSKHQHIVRELCRLTGLFRNACIRIQWKKLILTVIPFPVVLNYSSGKI